MKRVLLLVLAVTTGAAASACYDFAADRRLCEDSGYCDTGAADSGPTIGPGDAGHDAGPGDSGTPDSGTPVDDAGFDAGTQTDGGYLVPRSSQLCDDHGWCWDRPWPQGHGLRGVWGTPSDLWAVGENAVEVHFPLDGGAPEAMNHNADDFHSTLNAITGFGDGLLAAGDATAIFSYRDGLWVGQPNPGAGNFFGLYAANGVAYAAGDATVLPLLATDGGAWTTVSVAGPLGGLSGLSGSSASDVWGVGPGGHVLHSEPAGFTALPAFTTDALTAVDVPLPGQVWMGSQAGNVYLRDGGSWQPVGTAFASVNALASLGGGTELVASQSGVVTCTPAGCGALDGVHRYNALYAPQPGLVYAVGDRGVVAILDGGWNELVPSNAPGFNALEVGPTGLPYVVATNGTVLRREPADWVQVGPPPAGNPTLNALCFDEGGTGWVPANDNRVYRLPPDGGALGGTGWKKVGGAPASTSLLAASCSGSDIWMAGEQGAIAWTPDGGVLRAVVDPVATAASLHGIWASDAGFVIAVGDVGTIVRATATGGTSVLDAGVTSDLYAVFGYGPDDFWVAGNDFTLLHWSNGAWTHLDPATLTGAGQSENLYSLWGPAPHELYATGSNGFLFHTTDDGATATSSPVRTGAAAIGFRPALGQQWMVDVEGGIHVRPAP